MTILIKGYFKFSKIKEICAKVPDSSVSESILKSAAGLDMYFTSGTCRDAWNAVCFRRFASVPAMIAVRNITIKLTGYPGS